MAPGAGGAVFADLDAPWVNAAGQTAFPATLSGTGVDSTNDGGVWSEGSGSLGLVARNGDVAPGTGGAVHVLLQIAANPAINDSGQTAFKGILTGAGVSANNDRTVWSEGGGALALVAREGSAAPGTGGAVFDELFDDPDLNASGRTAFQASLPSQSGYWSETGVGGALRLVARGGDTAPGTGGAVFTSLNASPAFNDAEQTAFRGSIGGAGVTSSNNTGVWSEGTGSLELVAREGSVAPGTGGSLHNGFNSPLLNGAGAAAFTGSLSGPGVTAANDSGLWSEGSGSLALVAREGDLAPGAGGDTYAFLFNHALNDAGESTIRVRLAGAGTTPSTDQAIFGPDGAGISLYFRGGEILPGMTDSLAFGFGNPFLNQNGDVLAISGLMDSGGGFAGEALLFASSPTNRQVIVSTGDVLAGRVVSALDIIPVGVDGSLGDGGDIAFLALFDDGSKGIFVANVPEPHLLGLLLLALGLTRARRR